MLNAYGRMTSENETRAGQDALGDLLGDLLHASDALGLSFVEALRRASVEKRCEVLAEIEDAFHRRPAAVPHPGGESDGSVTAPPPWG